MSTRLERKRRAADHSVRAFGLLVAAIDMRSAASTLTAHIEDEDLVTLVRKLADRVDARRRRLQEREP